MIPLALLSVGKNFKSIQSNILKIVKIKDQEKLQKKFDKTRARQQSYKSRYQQPTQVKKISVKDSASSMLSGLGGILKALFVIIGTAGLFSILKSTGVGKYIFEFIKSSLNSIIDLIGKAFKFIGEVLSDAVVQSSLYKLVISFFKFVGTLIVAAASLAASLLRDSEVLDTLKTTVVAVFNAAIEGIKASYEVISKLVMDNWETIKQTAFDVFIEVKNALILSLKTLGSIFSGGLDPRITSGLKEIFVSAWDFITELFTTEFKDPETGKSFTLLKEGFIWVAKMGALAAAWLIFGAYLKEKGKALAGVSFQDLKQDCSACMGMDLPDGDDKKGKKGKGRYRSAGRKPPIQTKGPSVTERFGKFVGNIADDVKSAAKNVWGKVSKFGEKVYQKGKALGNKIYKVVENAISKVARYLQAIGKNPRILKKVLGKIGQKLGQFAAKLASRVMIAAAGITTGGVVTAIMGILVTYDLIMMFYGIYELLFVSTDGETEDGGYFKEIKSEIEADIKEDTKPQQVATTPLATPSSAPAPESAPMPAVKTTTKKGAGRTRYSTKKSPSPAPVAASTPTPTLASTPAPVPISSMSVPSSVDIEKRQVSGLGYKGPRKRTDGVIIHHTGGSGLDTAIQTLQKRKLSYHYLVDRNGKVVQIVPDELRASHAGVTNKKPGFNNDNTVSISMVAKDDNDVTPEQIAAASSLEAMLAKKYGFAKTNAFGHGEVSSGKHPKEGFTIASAIRSGRVDQAVEGITEKSLEGIKQNAPPSVNTQTTGKAGDVLDAASNQVSSGLRMLEDIFIDGRPSFTDLSTTVIQNNTIKKPGGNVREKEQKSIDILLARQSSYT